MSTAVHSPVHMLQSNLQDSESLLFPGEPIALCHPILLKTHHCVPQTFGPGVSGGIPSLKSNLTVNSLYAGPITGESNPGLDNMQLVFVYKAQAKSEAWSGKIQFKGASLGCPDSPLRSTSFVLHLLCEIGILLTCWESGRNREIDAMHFFLLRCPRAWQ